MIAYLHGTLQNKNTEQVIVDIHGIGYQVCVPLSTFYKLPEAGEEVKLLIHTSIREESWQLFGFLSSEEKELFELMLKVSKIGPKLARNILSHISTGEFKSAIRSSDVSRMRAIPGIGEKTASRLILELKDKIPAQQKSDSTTSAPPASSVQQLGHQPAGGEEEDMQSDAVSALISLGYNRLTAERAVNQIIHREANLSIEELIKKALNRLAG
ncbi:MAG: Holliday junction branch migration protein RuvA [bacterium]